MRLKLSNEELETIRSGLRQERAKLLRQIGAEGSVGKPGSVKEFLNSETVELSRVCRLLSRLEPERLSRISWIAAHRAGPAAVKRRKEYSDWTRHQRHSEILKGWTGQHP